MFDLKLLIELLIYLACLVPLLIKVRFPARGKAILILVHLISIALLFVNLLLYIGFEISLRGNGIELVLFILMVYSPVVLFSMYRKQVDKIVRQYVRFWVFYPCLLIIIYPIKPLFYILALPLMILNEDTEKYAEQPGSYLSKQNGFMVPRGLIQYHEYQYFLFEKTCPVSIDYEKADGLHKDSIRSYRLLSDDPLVEITWYDHTKDTAK